MTSFTEQQPYEVWLTVQAPEGDGRFALELNAGRGRQDCKPFSLNLQRNLAVASRQGGKAKMTWAEFLDLYAMDDTGGSRTHRVRQRSICRHDGGGLV